jgi:hypothetical protein
MLQSHINFDNSGPFLLPPFEELATFAGRKKETG